jgi:hypothetical protein
LTIDPLFDSTMEEEDDIVVVTLNDTYLFVSYADTIWDLKRVITPQEPTDWQYYTLMRNGHITQDTDATARRGIYRIVQTGQTGQPGPSIPDATGPPAKKPRLQPPPREQDCTLSLCSRAGKKFTCPKCAANTCLPCLATGLNDHEMEIKCPSCMTEIPENIWQASFPANFVNKVLRKRAGRDLPSHLDRNRALLQDRAAAEVKRRGLQQQLQKLAAQMDVLKKQERAQATLRDTPSPLSLVHTTIPCLTPTCHAYLNAGGKCSVCDKSYCLTCRVGAHGTAPCNSEDLETQKALALYKLCPNPTCGARIERVSGCTTMFCVICKTQYDEQTREINTGPAQHNPELAVWVSQGNVFGEILPNLAGLYHAIPDLRPLRGFANFHRSMEKMLQARVDMVALDKAHRLQLDKYQIDFIIGSKVKSATEIVPYPDVEYQRDLARATKSHQYATAWSRLVLKACEEGLGLLQAMKARGAFGWQAIYADIERFAKGTNEDITKLADFYGSKPKGSFNLSLEYTYSYLSFQ